MPLGRGGGEGQKGSRGRRCHVCVRVINYE